MAIVRNRAFAIRLMFELLRVRHSFPLSKGRLRLNLGLALSYIIGPSAVRENTGVRTFGRSEGGVIRYQPTSASAVAWRSCILLFLEARIVGSDAVRNLVAQRTVEIRLSVLFDFAMTPSCNCVLAISFVFKLRSIRNSLPLSQGRVGVNEIRKARSIADCAAHRIVAATSRNILMGRYHQVPAYKRERGGVAKLHSTFS